LLAIILFKTFDPKHKQEVKREWKSPYQARKKMPDVQQRPIRPNQQLELKQ